MRRYVAFAVAAVALTYFLDPDNGAGRRNRVRAWFAGDSEEPDEPGLTDGQFRPEAVPVARPIVRPEPVVGDATAPATEEAASAVAVADRPVGETTLPLPLPHDVLATPAPEAPHVVEEQPPSPKSKRRGWLLGAAVLVAAALVAGGLSAWSLDVFDDESDGGPSSAARALSALAERQARAISIMAQPGATRLPVVGAEESLLLVVGMEGDAVLIVSRLERAPAGQTYEIWVISGETASPAGLLRGGRDTVVPLTRAVPKGATVALTLERLGGSPRPTSDPLFAVTRD